MRHRLAALLVLAGGCGAPPGAAKEIVVIPQGATVRAVAESLAAHGVIASPWWFRLLARAGRYDRRVKSGAYELPRRAGALAALRLLAGGHPILVKLTVPEGSSLLDIAALAAAALHLDRDSLLAAARDTALLREFGVPAGSLEGFVAPDTYLLSPGLPARAVVREMAAVFRQHWNPAWDQAAAAQGLDRLGLVTLASIVEGEARAEEDRPLIAAVYLNRMRRGMPLQADPTVQYAIALESGARKPRLHEKDYGIESPYNTYLHPGLPPGPVGAPGRASIEAVLTPAPVPFLYFVAGPDGRHIFSRSYEEHLRAVRRVRRSGVR
jgi:peptidoglycan lytic transglycosylase G